MAVTDSPRLGLTRWSAGTDPLTRLQLDGDHAALDDFAVMSLRGTLANRPAAGVVKRIYEVTGDATASNNGRLFWDTGSAWQEVARSDVTAHILDADLTVTVGTGGDYTTINAALAALSRRHPAHVAAGFTAEVRLLTGYAMAEQVLISGVDLGFVRITAVDATVSIIRSALTTQFGVGGTIPAFGAVGHATLPIIAALFDMDASGVGTERTGIHVSNGSHVTVENGCGVTAAADRGLDVHDGSTFSARYANFSMAGNIGARIANGSIGTLRWANLSGAGLHGLYAGFAYVNAGNANVSGAANTGIRAESGAVVAAASADASSGGIGVEALSGSIVDFAAGIATGCTSAVIATSHGIVVAKSATITGATDRGVYARQGGRVDAQLADASGATNYGMIAQVGGWINAKSANGQRGASASPSDFRVEEGSTIIAHDAIGGVSQRANLVTGNGAIVKATTEVLAPSLSAAVGWTIPGVVDGGAVSIAVTVTGAAVGDTAVAALSTLAAGWLLSANVTAADTVTVTAVNHTGASNDPAFGTLEVRVLKKDTAA